jgi:hypothetical protein
MAPVPPINLRKLAIKVAAWLQCWRLIVSDELVAEYVRSLKAFTETEVMTALERAKNESQGDYAPVPGVVYGIVMEMRRGETFDEESDCALCAGVGFRVVKTHAGEVAIPCRCMKPETKQRVEKHLNEREFYSAKVFARKERRARVS